MCSNKYLGTCALVILLASRMFGADAANDIVLSQRNATNNGFSQRNVSPVADDIMYFGDTKLPSGSMGTKLVFGRNSRYLDGLFSIDNTGGTFDTIYIGDGSADQNNTSILLADAGRLITYTGLNGHTFFGSPIRFNSFSTNGFVKFTSNNGTIGTDTNTYALASSVPLSANPTASVGTAVINGSATTFMRSDAAPPVNLAMTPNWTGLHNFLANTNMPATTANKLAGVIQQAGVPIFHTYNGAPGIGTLGQHIFIGPNCGNFTNNLADTNIGIGGFDSENLTTTTFASLTNGKENIAIGFGDLGLLTGGVGNCAVGAANSENVTSGSGNSAFGTNCFFGGSGSQNTCFGNLVAANMGGAASNNSLFGYASGTFLGNTSNNNTCFGFNSIGKVSTGSNNTAFGYQAGFGGTGVVTFSNDIFIGAFAGQYEQTVSNEFFLNNQDRLTYTGDKTLSLLYGTMAATAAAQTLICNGALTSSVSIGYPTALGVGGTVTQATSRTTGVTLNTITGLITGNGTALPASTTVTFTVTDSQVAAVDLPVLAIKSGANASTLFTVSAVAAGSFNISETNTNTLTADTSVPLIKFAILKASEN